MDILVTFEDGTTELRASNAPFRHQIPHYDEHLFRDGLPTWAQMRGYVHRFDNCGRAGNWVFVWRIVGCNPLTGALLGEWQRARVETVDEQLERLTRERDAAKADVTRARDRIGELVGMLRAVEKIEVDEETGETLFDGGPVSKIFARVILHALTKAPNFYTFQVREDGQPVAILTVQRPTGKTPEERYHEEKKRLADLRGEIDVLHEWASRGRCAWSWKAYASELACRIARLAGKEPR